MTSLGRPSGTDELIGSRGHPTGDRTPYAAWYQTLTNRYSASAPGFGPVSIGVVAALVALVAAAIWIARHPRSGRLLVAHIVKAPPVRGIAESMSRWGAATPSVRARLRVEDIAGIALLAGLGAVVVLAVSFTALLDDVLEGDGVAEVDHPAARWLAENRDLWLTRIFLVVTQAADPAGQAVWVMLVCALAAWRARSWLPVLLGVVGGGGISVVVVTAARRWWGASVQGPPSP